MKVKQRRLNGWRRLFLMPLLLPTVLPLVLAASLVTYAASPVQSPLLVGPKQHYLSLGDSNAFGFQPNGDFTHGYVPDLFQILQHEGTKGFTNLACPDETTETFINGSICSYSSYSSQLKAAEAFLQANAGKVSPVTLSIGGNDVQFDIDLTTCQVNEQKFSQDLAMLDSNLKGVILPGLQQALTDKKGHITGSIVMMNLYDPFQNICPNSVSFTQTVNQHLANDMSGFGVIADVFTAFGGPNTPNLNLCTYTWMCTPPPLGPDGHCTSIGYQVIANTFAAVIPKN